MASTTNPYDCPCGRTDASGRKLSLAGCCGPILAGVPAPDAEALMRSRYTAFVLGDAPYLLASWHASTRPDTIEMVLGVFWLGLEVREHKRIDDDHAQVEFVARSRSASGRAARLHERSRFVREGGHWFYVDGELR